MSALKPIRFLSGWATHTHTRTDACNHFERIFQNKNPKQYCISFDDLLYALIALSLHMNFCLIRSLLYRWLGQKPQPMLHLMVQRIFSFLFFNRFSVFVVLLASVPMYFISSTVAHSYCVEVTKTFCIFFFRNFLLQINAATRSRLGNYLPTERLWIISIFIKQRTRKQILENLVCHKLGN